MNPSPKKWTPDDIQHLRERLSDLLHDFFHSDGPYVGDEFCPLLESQGAFAPILLTVCDSFLSSAMHRTKKKLWYLRVFPLCLRMNAMSGCTAMWPRAMEILGRLQEGELEKLFGEDPRETAKDLCSVFDGDVAPLKSILFSRRTSYAIRYLMLRAFRYLFLAGKISRETVDEFHRELASRTYHQSDVEYWSAVAEEVAAIGNAEMRNVFLEVLHYIGEEGIPDAEVFARLEAELAEDRIPDRVMEEFRRPSLPMSVFLRENYCRGRRICADQGCEINWPVSRNDLCPCGSGRKFKQCCLPQVQLSSDVQYNERGDVVSFRVGMPGNEESWGIPGNGADSEDDELDESDELGSDDHSEK